MFEGGVNSAAALFGESTSSPVGGTRLVRYSNVAIRHTSFYIIILELNM